MDAYVYDADIYCEDCGRAIRERIDSEGKAPTDPDDESTYDSGEYPKGPYDDGGGEADTPQHCGAGADCLNAIELDGQWVGAFLENPLTSGDRAYVEEQARENPTECIKLWCEHYGIPVGYRGSVTASGKIGDHELTGIPVENPGGWFGKAWLIEIGMGYSSSYFVVEADSPDAAIDEFSDSEHGHLIHVEEPDLKDYDPETCHYDGSGRVIDLDNLMIHGLEGYGVEVPFQCLYHAQGLPSKGIDPRKLNLYECID